MTAGGNSDARNRRQSEEELQIRPLSEHVGAEISGVNLATDLADDTFEMIDDAYNRYSVLVFRDQKLTPEQQIAFARRFGELEISPRTQFALPGHPEILTRLRLRPTRCISWRGWCKWTPVEPAGTCPGYRSSKLDGSEDPWTTGARDEHTAIGGGSLA